MTNNPKNSFTPKVKNNESNIVDTEQNQVPLVRLKDIFDDDKLLQAEKRWQHYRDQSDGSAVVLSIFIPFFLLSFAFVIYMTETAYSWKNELPTASLSLVAVVVLFLSLHAIYRIVYVSPKFKRLPHYFSCIAESKNGSLDDISSSLGYPYEVVISDIEFLINKGILEKTFINHSKRTVSSSLIGESIVKKSKNVSCPNCGATNEVIGKATECEYCGSTISVNS